MNPFFTIIVPAYNEQDCIAKTLESLKSQNFKDLEIIVIDNNSTDSTSKIAKKIVKSVFLEKKQGYMHAVNAGVSRAKGKFIAVADADSIYPPNWLSRAYSRIEKNPNIVAVYGSCRFYDNNFLINWLSAPSFSLFLILSKLLGHHNTAGFNFIMSKEAYNKSGGYDPSKYNSVGTDLELGLRISKLGKMELDASSIVFTSSRRFKKNGVFGTTWLFLESWWNLHTGKAQRVDYSAYNKERR